MSRTRALLVGTVLVLLALAPAAGAQGLWPILDRLAGKKRVDLTHPFDTDSPHWKGFEPMTRKVLYDYDKDGFRAELFCHVGQWGTHVDPPAPRIIRAGAWRRSNISTRRATSPRPATRPPTPIPASPPPRTIIRSRAI